jgi:hypothetical protein
MDRQVIAPLRLPRDRRPFDTAAPWSRSGLPLQHHGQPGPVRQMITEPSRPKDATSQATQVRTSLRKNTHAIYLFADGS